MGDSMSLLTEAVAQELRRIERYRVIDYIRDYYEALHTTGRQYIVDGISMYIEARQTSMA